MIDLRSDTLTRPSEAMLTAMTRSEVGDDVYAEDPTIAELEHRTAELLGHEAGLFCVTGSMANMLGVWLNTRPGYEVLCDQQAHIVRAEMGGHAELHGVTMRTWRATSGTPGIATVADATEMITTGTGPFLVQTSLVEIENTHNFGGGTIHPIETLRGIRQACQGYGVKMHLDGARLWNAHVAAGVPMAEYGTLFDTVSICYSKGMGAPVGSVLVGAAEDMNRARVQRKRLGGGWRQAGVLAAAALHALDHNVDRLADDHANARLLAERVALKAPGVVDPERVPTNIVVLDTGAVAAADVVSAAGDRGVAVSMVGAHLVRAVTHLDVDADGCRIAGEVLGDILAS